MPETEKEAYIAFSAFYQFGPKKFGLLKKYFGSARKAWSVGVQEYREMGFSEKNLAEFEKFRKEFALGEYLKKLEKLGIEVVILGDKEYPERLKEIDDAPFLLYAKSSLSLSLRKISEVAVAVVGARKMSAYGRQVCERLVSGLCDAGVTIVSGLALGIDAVAHRTALECNGKTIGVLGCGLDQVYPPSNQGLARQMVESGRGVLVSEFPLGYPALPVNFPTRNRVVSGLSLGVVVIEGETKSGTLLTASSAASQGREVFAVPGSILSPNSGAPHFLLKNGAKLVSSVGDILEELKIESRILNLESREILPETAEEKVILEVLGKDGMSADELVRTCNLPTSAILGALTRMELKGIVKNVGGVYVKV